MHRAEGGAPTERRSYCLSSQAQPKGCGSRALAAMPANLWEPRPRGDAVLTPRPLSRRGRRSYEDHRAEGGAPTGRRSYTPLIDGPV